MFEFMDSHTDEAVIKVIGVGGGGGNAVEHMVRQNIEGVEFITVNTDAQALRNSSANTTLQIGGGITKGLGAGANPVSYTHLLLSPRRRPTPGPETGCCWRRPARAWIS